MKLLQVEAEEPPSRPQATSQSFSKTHSLINALAPAHKPRLDEVVRAPGAFPGGAADARLPQALLSRDRTPPSGTIGAGRCARASARWPSWSASSCLSDDERDAVVRPQGSLPVGITPYYASLMARDDPPEPLRRTASSRSAANIVRTARRGRRSAGRGPRHRRARPRASLSRPRAVPHHRLLLDLLPLLHALAHGGRAGGEYTFSTSNGRRRSTISRRTPRSATCCSPAAIRCRIGDDKLDWLLGRLRAIKHIEFLRIGTKIPVVLPQRITHGADRGC